MAKRFGLLFGPLAAAILGLGIAALPLMVPGYSPVRQTVSEIGEMGSPAQVPFTCMLLMVGTCILVFAWTLRDLSVSESRSRVPAYFVGFMAVSAFGVGLFPYPHELHNQFGLSELIGFQAPLVLALTWRSDPRAHRLVSVTSGFAVLMWLAIGLNLSTLARHGALWAYERPFYGLVQRSLFAVWFGWCGVVGVMLFAGDSRESPISTGDSVHRPRK